METVITIHPYWAKAEKDLMRRLAAAIIGPLDHWDPSLKEGGRWQLDPGNTWWAELRGNCVTLVSRYGGKKHTVIHAFLSEWLG